MLVARHGSSIRPCRAKTELIYKVRIVQEVVEAKYATLPLLLEQFLVGNDVGWVHLGDDVDAVVDVPHAVTSSSDLTSLGLGVEYQALGRVGLVDSSGESLHFHLLRELALLNDLILAHLLLCLEDLLMKNREQVLAALEDVAVDVL